VSHENFISGPIFSRSDDISKVSIQNNIQNSLEFLDERHELVSAFKGEEEGRLRALARLNILDTVEEQPFEGIVDLVCQVLDAPICAISLVDRDRQWFKAYRGLDVCETARDISFCTHAITSIEPFIIEDASVDPRFSTNPLVTGAPHIRSYVGIPLATPEGYNIGTLCVIDTVPRRFAEKEIAILSSFAKVVVGEIDLRQIGAIDVLTGIMSRRAWIDSAEREIGRAQRYGTPLAILIIDIDHFKRINDRTGHAVGDQIISRVVQAVTAQLRQSDCFGRYGGEEFALALPETKLDDAMAIAEQLRVAIGKMPITCLGDKACTISIGVTDLGDGESSLSPALHRANIALGQAKCGGRNQVKVIASFHQDSYVDFVI